ncbi:MAG: DUF1295 domain-containing protein [Bacteroidales bacterium]|nr:DUF1295 domain-containing protein [Bacteroidales bacterium]
MSLYSQFVREGNMLFRYRSFIPLILFIVGVPFLLFERSDFGNYHNWLWGLTCFSISLLGQFIRFVVLMQTPAGTSGRNIEKQVALSLNTKGIYSVVRHPLYVGNFFMWLGLIIYAGSIEFLLFSIAFFWIYYERIMFAEEEFLREKFGKAFEQWAEKTPAFFPSFKHYEPTKTVINLKRFVRREYHSISALIISFIVLNFLKNFLQDRQFFIDKEWIIALLIVLPTYILFRILVKKTTLFQDK